MNLKTASILFLFLAMFSCKPKEKINSTGPSISSILNASFQQLDLLVETSYKADRIPRSEIESGEVRYVNDGFDWTEGFFPGTIWFAYENTNNAKYKTAAEYFQSQFLEHRFLTTHHDLGFVFNNSFGKAYQLTKNEDYKQVLVDAGNSLIQRYNPTIGCIQSWDVDEGWQAQRGWKFPVIIDNMMNLEMLFELSEITQDPKYRDIAIKHANTTLKNHFREDYSSYHVVDYDLGTGEVRSKQTAQGHAHESAWSRGQSWGLYGYTVCYRFTKDERYLKLAENIANYILTHKNLPEDKVPYWDFNAPSIPDEPRDASAAAIIASALIELDAYSDKDFLTPAKTIVQNLASDKYMAEKGTNNNFILKHSVGSIPHNAEIDVPLIYADYYFIEALARLNKL